MMKFITGARRRMTLAGEAGLSLVEVLVAVLIITIIAVSSATLVGNGIAAGATLERKQVAVTIASGAMESVSAQSVTALYTGRTFVALDPVWTANSTAPGIPQTYERWDTVTASTTPTVPITSTTAQAGTSYKITTLIGNCYQPAAGGDCGKVTGYLGATPPVTLPSNFTILIRVVVIVSWTAGKTCAAGCKYVATTLVDPNSDLEWITHA